MHRHSVKFGIDRCPATKNYTHRLFCRNCDFRASEEKDCCECTYYKINKKERSDNTIH